MPDETITPERRFAARTRELRRALAWSQPRLADEIAAVGGPRLDPSNVARLERTDRRITLDEAYAIADALGSTVESMVGDGVNQADRERLAEIRAAEDALAEAQHRLDRARGRGTVTGDGELSDEEAAQEVADQQVMRDRAAAGLHPHTGEPVRDGADQ